MRGAVFSSNSAVDLWPVLYLPLFGALGAALVAAIGDARRDLGGAALMVAPFAVLGAALLLELLAVVEGLGAPWLRPGEIALEEMLELLGTAMLGAAMAGLLLVRFDRRWVRRDERPSPVAPHA